MKAEFSNVGYKDDEFFTGIYQRMGAMICDRDLNAQVEISDNKFQWMGDITASNGVPKHGGILKLEDERTALFRSEGGIVVADGVIGHLRPLDPKKPFSFKNQKSLPFAPQEPRGDAIAYVDISDRFVAPHDNPDLIDVALKAQTIAATERIAQIKICNKEHLIEGDCGYYVNPDFIPPHGNWTVEASWRRAAQSDDACNPCEAFIEVDRPTHNELFRVEVHNIENDQSGVWVTFKFSSENGAIHIPKEETTNLSQNFIYEIRDADQEFNMGVPVEGPSANVTRGQLTHSVGSLPAGKSVIRWDGMIRVNLKNPHDFSGFEGRVALQQNKVSFANGVLSIDLNALKLEIKLQDENEAPNNFLIGDYHLVLMRSDAPLTEKIRVLSQDKPKGIHHRYCVLGYLEDNQIKLLDSPTERYRLNFPDLTCLKAKDIPYEGKCNHGPNATNVQDLLDEFCEKIDSILDQDKQPTTHPTIKSITWNGINKEDKRHALFNDRTVSIEELKQGFTINFSNPVMTNHITNDVVSFSAEVPTSTRTDIREAKLGIRSFDDDLTLTRVVIQGNIQASNNGESVTFIPEQYQLENVLEMAKFEVAHKKSIGEDYWNFRNMITFRLKINGGCIFRQSDQKHLAAFIPGIIRSEDRYVFKNPVDRVFDDTDLVLGDGRLAAGTVLFNEAKMVAPGNDPNHTIEKRESFLSREPNEFSSPVTNTNTNPQQENLITTDAVIKSVADNSGTKQVNDLATFTEPEFKDFISLGLFDQSKFEWIALDYGKAGFGNDPVLNAWFYCNVT